MHDVSSEAAKILDRVGAAPRVGLILGSGLGALAESADDASVVATRDIAGYPQSTVAGHDGRLVFGSLEGESVVFACGRVHLYEGYGIDQVTFPVRLLRALGVDRLVLTNAAGGINAAFPPGTLMFITDHINLSGSSAASTHTRRAGGNLHARSRIASPYSATWRERAGLATTVANARGVYAWTRGPSYETKAEIAAYRRLGADAVGMSTVPEAAQAAALDMDVLGISTITNYAAGLSAAALSHADVLEVGRRARSDLERLVRDVVGIAR